MKPTASRSNPLPLGVHVRRLVLGLAALLLMVPSLPVLADSAPPGEGRDYQRIDPPQPIETPGKVEVIFFFGYWCPHCNEFDPGFLDWSKKQAADVAIRHVPIAFAAWQEPLQRLFYVDHNPLNTLELQTQFVQKNGIDPKKYTDLYNSFSIQTRVRRATQMAQNYGVDGIPFVAVDGKYHLGEQANTFAVLDSLVANERKVLTAGKP